MNRTDFGLQQMGLHWLGRIALQGLMVLGAASAGAVGGAALTGTGGNGALRPVQSLIEAALDATLSALPPSPSAIPPDLNDGRSAVSPRWRHALQVFAADDRDHAPADGGIVFVGSSSISLWDGLESEFPPYGVIRRGLGGATMADCARHVDRLVLPYRPRVVVVYAGDNDLAAGASPESVLADYAGFARLVLGRLPQTRIVFLSVKPSPAREALMPAARRFNALIAAHVRSDPRLDFVDVFSPMLDAQGHVRPELYLADALHPNAAGYAIWKTAITEHLD